MPQARWGAGTEEEKSEEFMVGEGRQGNLRLKALQSALPNSEGRFGAIALCTSNKSTTAF